MIKRRLGGFVAIFCAIDCAIAWGLFWLSYYFVFAYLGVDPVDSSRYLNYSLVVVLVVGLFSFHTPASANFSLSVRGPASLRSAFRTSLSVGFVLLMLLILNKDMGISRWFVCTYAVALITGLTLFHSFLPGWLTKVAFVDRRCPTIILSCGKREKQMIEWVRARTSYGFDLIGRIAESPLAIEKDGLPLLGGVQEMDRILAETKASLILVADAPSRGWNYQALKRTCDSYGARLIIAGPALVDVEDRLSFIDDDGIQMLGFRHEPLESPSNRMIKRLMDLAIALPVVVFILPPLALVVWLLQRAQCPGPLFYRQMRVGLEQELFSIFKFRTMQDRDFDQTVQASVNDERVFPAGRILRKLSLDEFPQFINVLRGEMSVVGPRPHIPEHEDKFSAAAGYHRIRSLIKPGITGLAQIQGLRGEASTVEQIAKRTDADLHYLEHWSVELDIRIILGTIFHTIRPPKTAY